MHVTLRNMSLTEEPPYDPSTASACSSKLYLTALWTDFQLDVSDELHIYNP